MRGALFASAGAAVLAVALGAGTLVVTEEGVGGRPISAVLSSFDAVAVDVRKLSCALVVQPASNQLFYSAPYPGVVVPVAIVGGLPFCRFEAWDFIGDSTLTSFYMYLLKEGVTPVDAVASTEPPVYTVDQALAAIYHKVGMMGAPSPITITSFPSNANQTTTAVSGAVVSLSSASSRMAETFPTVAAAESAPTKAYLFSGTVRPTGDGIGVPAGGSGSPVVGDDGMNWKVLGTAADVDASTGRFSFPDWAAGAAAAGVEVTAIAAFKALVVPSAVSVADHPMWLVTALAAAEGVWPMGFASSTSGASSDTGGGSGGSASSSSSSKTGLHPAIIVIIVAGAVLAIAGIAGLALAAHSYKQAKRSTASSSSARNEDPAVVRSALSSSSKKKAVTNSTASSSSTTGAGAAAGGAAGALIELPEASTSSKPIAVVAQGGTPQASGGSTLAASSSSSSTGATNAGDGATSAIVPSSSSLHASASSGLSLSKVASQTSISTAAPSEYLHIGSSGSTAAVAVVAASAATAGVAAGGVAAAGAGGDVGAAQAASAPGSSPLHHAGHNGGSISNNSLSGGGRTSSVSSLSFIDVRELQTPEAARLEGAVVIAPSQHEHHQEDSTSTAEDQEGEGSAQVAPGAIVTPLKERNKQSHPPLPVGVSAPVSIQRRGFPPVAASHHAGAAAGGAGGAGIVAPPAVAAAATKGPSLAHSATATSSYVSCNEESEGTPPAAPAAIPSSASVRPPSGAGIAAAGKVVRTKQ